ncbi:hydrolase [Kitasatospora sp. KL5]|uniref:hydrolase n=1 Tax=Kitasatospora sp. KL5 TaxID=3425125 RepID=UPI003D6DABD6
MTAPDARPATGPDTLLSRLPPALLAVPYVGARHPLSRAVAERPGPEHGANCQLYAYAVLAHFGLRAPALRSSDLWEDTGSTLRVAEPAPLDLLLFNAGPDPYGAHVGVCAGEGAVLHLCAEVGRPAVWSLAEFAARERYRVLIGAKRVTA